MSVGVALGAEPQEWLERMNHALTTRNYVGVFTHKHGGRVETLRIIHRVRGRDVSERLLSLDGPGREFIREGDELTCYFPDKRMVLVERRAPDGPLLGALPPLDESDSHVYEIRGGERERLLGRNTRVVALQPRDEFRYGYRLWIDEETSMPLKTQLCDQPRAKSSSRSCSRTSTCRSAFPIRCSSRRWMRPTTTGCAPIASWPAIPRRRCGKP